MSVSIRHQCSKLQNNTELYKLKRIRKSKNIHVCKVNHSRVGTICSITFSNKIESIWHTENVREHGTELIEKILRDTLLRKKIYQNKSTIFFQQSVRLTRGTRNWIVIGSFPAQVEHSIMYPKRGIQSQYHDCQRIWTLRPLTHLKISSALRRHQFTVISCM